MERGGGGATTWSSPGGRCDGGVSQRCRFAQLGGRARQRAVHKTIALLAFLAACCVLSKIKTLAPESNANGYLAGRRLLAIAGGGVAEADDGFRSSAPETDVSPAPTRHASPLFKREASPENSAGPEDKIPPKEDGTEPKPKSTGGKEKPKDKDEDEAGKGKGKHTVSEPKGDGKAGQSGVQVETGAAEGSEPEPKEPSGQKASKDGAEDDREANDKKPKAKPETTAETEEKEKPPKASAGKTAEKSEQAAKGKSGTESTAEEERSETAAKPEQEPKTKPDKPETDTKAKPKSKEEEPATKTDEQAEKPKSEDQPEQKTKQHKPKPKPTEESKPSGKEEQKPSEPEKTEGRSSPEKGRTAGEEGEGEESKPKPPEEGVAPAKNVSENATEPGAKEKWRNETKNEEEGEGEAIDCIRPAYHEFPPDLFSHEARARGGVIVHILVVLYMFYALAVVCDDYFIASLEECCARLNLSEDVAGATFMAAGSSAPELFTAILGVLIAKGDVGTGTIVGSAVFNVLFVIGLCGLCSGKEVPVTWWPLFRDSLFYAFTVVILILVSQPCRCYRMPAASPTRCTGTKQAPMLQVIYDGQVTWYDSLFMLLLYGVYIDIMKYNKRIHQWIATTFGIHEEEQTSLGLTSAGYDAKNYSSY
ncbi:hypothetical protein V5799_017059, partial [Amblyomma americanum]